jgi:hypothetical protein
MSGSPALKTALKKAFDPSILPLPTPAHLADKLSSYIQARPNRETVECIAEFFVLQAHKHPQDVERSIRAISILEDIFATPPITCEYYRGEMIDVRNLLRTHLLETISDVIHENTLEDDEPEHNTVERTNPCISASILSAAAIKHGMFVLTRVPYAITRMGLQIKDRDLPPLGRKGQVYAACACLHLLVAGSVMMQSFVISEGYEGIHKALLSLKNRRVLHGTGQALLEVSSPRAHLTPTI